MTWDPFYWIRPKTRGECEHAPRPCPWVSCRHHLYADIKERTGRLLVQDDEPWDLPETCSLDVANHGGETLEYIGALLGLTRERVRQIEDIALRKVRRRGGHI